LIRLDRQRFPDANKGMAVTMLYRTLAVPDHGLARLRIPKRLGAIQLLVLTVFATVFASGALTAMIAFGPARVSWTGAYVGATKESASMRNGLSKSHFARSTDATVSGDYVEILLRVIDENQSAIGSQRR
jgi:hypothetical protein